MNLQEQFSKSLKLNIQSKLILLIFILLKILKSKYFIRDAGKITGMIVDLGIQEMVKLINNRDELQVIIEEAHQVKIIFFIYF